VALARLRWEARLQSSRDYSGVAAAITSILSAALFTVPSVSAKWPSPGPAAGAALAIVIVALFSPV